MAAATVQSSTNLFRRLAWNATVPLEIRLANADGRAVDRYYVSRQTARPTNATPFADMGAVYAGYAHALCTSNYAAPSSH